MSAFGFSVFYLRPEFLQSSDCKRINEVTLLYKWKLNSLLHYEFVQSMAHLKFFFLILPVPHSMWGLGSLPRGQTTTPVLEAWSFICWTIREVPPSFFLVHFKGFFSSGIYEES